MKETEIDYVVADDLMVGDLIKVPDYGIVTVTRKEVDGDLVMAYTDADSDDPFTFAWDEEVTLYGY